MEPARLHCSHLTVPKPRQQVPRPSRESFFPDILLLSVPVALNATPRTATAEHVATKTAVQIRSHAQKFFSKVRLHREPHEKVHCCTLCFPAIRDCPTDRRPAQS